MYLYTRIYEYGVYNTIFYLDKKLQNLKKLISIENINEHNYKFQYYSFYQKLLLIVINKNKFNHRRYLI